jgi:hypothetical protein
MASDPFPLSPPPFFGPHVLINPNGSSVLSSSASSTASVGSFAAPSKPSMHDSPFRHVPAPPPSSASNASFAEVKKPSHADPPFRHIASSSTAKHTEADNFVAITKPSLAEPPFRHISGGSGASAISSSFVEVKKPGAHDPPFRHLNNSHEVDGKSRQQPRHSESKVDASDLGVDVDAKSPRARPLAILPSPIVSARKPHNKKTQPPLVDSPDVHAEEIHGGAVAYAPNTPMDYAPPPYPGMTTSAPATPIGSALDVVPAKKGTHNEPELIESPQGVDGGIDGSFGNDQLRGRDPLALVEAD